MNDSKVMMSSELSGLIPELEDQLNTGTEFPVAECKFSDQQLPIRFSLKSIMTSTPTKLEITTNLEDALKILKNKTSILIEKIQLIYYMSTVEIGGPFTIGDVGLKDIDYQSQNCTLSLELFVDPNKKVIF